MEVFTILIFIDILVNLVIIAYLIKERNHSIRMEKMPFLKEDKWSDDMWPEKATPKKRGRPVGSKNKAKVTERASR